MAFRPILNKFMKGILTKSISRCQQMDELEFVVIIFTTGADYQEIPLIK
jgi:hypothetical protein